jgi:RimJ/RimL family protein N-acetyltransferase
MAASLRMSRSAWPALARSPGLVVAAVVSLGVGIAANLTVFGVLRAIEFPVLPYPDAARLVQIDASNVVRAANGYPVSLTDIDDVRRSSRSFASVGASSDATMTIREGTEPTRISVKKVTGGFFTTLGIPAALGRIYTDGDASLTNVIVASDRLWREQLRADANGADPGRLVRHLLRDGVRVAIVGAVVGVLAARAGGRMLRSLVYGVGTTDLVSFAASVLMIEHFESLQRCVATVASERRYIAILDGPTVEKLKSFVTGIREANGVHLIAVDASGEVVGWCDVVRFQLEGFRHVGRLGMGLVPRARGTGLGRRLVEETLKSARDRGIQRVQLDVFASNTRAIKLYQNLGFEAEGRQRRARKLDGEYDDLVLMALLFDA